ncbi:cysteine hydrolase family protein [Sphaerospermopsis aphanizomenoides BCCUSP55]|uniref:cysteine hydrolase family protein n=1 Tax=Sphaerospermopsis aphanizomenoides TaxID=459663 RepID=UPI0019074880|nr:cysteine hydrolase family protein [Sphaerospermopsis aphanizomenoides]MBK1987050.1 cysteine hydrolase family protein [Sphaerospermopsis aphanizomenoides BCCUSP55]
MNISQSALILIGFQNDYFDRDGILYSVIEESSQANDVVNNTVNLLRKIIATPILIITTPIFFTPDYSELFEPVGILKTIKEMKAFRQGTKGAEMIAEFREFEDRILEIPGKRGLNAFSNTDLDSVLKSKNITNVILAGTVTSICIDSTGRYAHEQGYQVQILSDCTSSRTIFEHEFYTSQIFPLYAQVSTSSQLLIDLQLC